MVEEFLLEQPDFSIVKPGPFLSQELVNERGFVKTYPDSDQLDGAFCVALKKKLGRDRKKP